MRQSLRILGRLRRARCRAGVAVAMAWPVCGMAGTVPYAKLVSSQIMFDKIPAEQRDKVRVRVAVTHADASDHTPIHLWVIDGGTRTDLPVAGGGILDLDLRQDWVARGVVVQTDQPEKSLRADVDIGIRVPAGVSMPDRYLRDAVLQTQAVIDAGARQMAGFLALFVTPRVKGVRIRLSRCCAETASITVAVRAQDFTQDASGTVTVPMAVLQAYDGGTVAVSAPVSVIDPWVDQ